MTSTPKVFTTMLDMVTRSAETFAAPQALAAAERTHITRVRTIFEDPNIVGAGVAEKVTAREKIGTLSLTFYVRKKIAKSRIKPELMLPPVMAAPNGTAIFTDVVEIGTVRPQAPLVKRKPIRSGYSAGHFEISAGTLGAIVNRQGKAYILSNSHVFADSGQARKGDAIYYPGPRDGGKAADTIAKLRYFKKFVVGEEFANVIDAALGELLAEKLSLVNHAIHGVKAPIAVADPERDMKVVAMGRTSGKTKSVIRDVDFRILADYDVGTVGFTGQVLCDPYTKPGDSGAIVVDAGSGAIVGLHFAGSTKGSIFTPIRTVMKALRFKF